MLGKTIAHYKIIEKLGEGGMGVVYSAEDTRIQRTVALKFLPHYVTVGGDEPERIFSEARAAGRLNHPNICTIFAVEETAQQRFIVMEYVQGKTLKELAQSRALSYQQALDYGIQITEALQEAHSNDIVHRDIKTENIMVNDRGQVKVMDFGLAKLKGSVRLTRTGTTVGTLAYMAPEQIDGRGADARSDIFSLGIVLYELLSGQHPFRGEHEAALVYSIMNEDPRPLHEDTSEVPPPLVKVLHRALEKNPEARYQTAREMLTDLRAVREDPSSLSSASIPTPSSRRQAHLTALRRRWSKPALIATLSGTVLIASSIIIIPYLGGSGAAAQPIAIAVISFDNQTGEPAFDYLRMAIPNLLITSLEQSPSLRVTTWERMRDLLRQMGREETQTIDRDLGFELCRRDSVPFIVLGSVTKAGTVFATTVKVLDIETMETLHSASSRGEGAGSILQHQIDELSRRIAEGIGLSSNQFSERTRPVADVTTSSLGAYDYYLKAMQALLDDWDNVTARQMFAQAVELDSTFANAYAGLAMSLGGLGLFQERNRALEMAKRYAHKASEIDSLYIDAEYAITIEKDSDKQARILEQILTIHPKAKRINLTLGDHYLDVDPPKARGYYLRALEADPADPEILNGVGYTYYEERDFEKALEYFDRYASLSPDHPNVYDSKGEVYFQLGWLDYALNSFRKAIEIRPDFVAPYTRAAYVYALKEQYEPALSLIDTVLSVAPAPSPQAHALLWKAFYSYWLGRRAEALRTVDAVKRLAEGTGTTAWGLSPNVLAAWIHYERNEIRRARTLLDEWQLGTPNAPAERRLWRRAYNLMAQAVFDVAEGNEDSARTRLDDLNRLLPQIATQEAELLMARDELFCVIFLLQKDYSGCIELSKTIRIRPLRHIYPTQTAFYNHPFQSDQLARAYEGIGQLDSAIAEYERLITFDPQTDNRRLINPLYRYRLGMLYESQGSAGKAIEQYEKFIELWKDAEPDRAELPDARSRINRLKGVT